MATRAATPWENIVDLHKQTVDQAVLADPQCEFAIGIYRLEPHQLHPLHLHTAAAEFYFVVAGRARFTVGDELVDGTPGTTIYLPVGLCRTRSRPRTSPSRCSTASRRPTSRRSAPPSSEARPPRVRALRHNHPMILAWASPPMIAVIVLVLVVFFYRKRIPALGKSIGQSLRKGKKQFDAHQEKLDKADEIEATVVSEEDVTRARQEQRERDEV